MRKNIKFKLTFILLILVFIMTSALGCKDGVSKEEAKRIQPITLNYWRVWDGEDSFKDIIKAYRAIHPNITVNYRKLRYEEYEKALLEGFADDRGPDIFSINAGWTQRYVNKIEPLPPKITMAFSTIKGSIKKETVIELRTTKSITTSQIKDDFVDVVYNNVLIDEEIYGLPLSVDTMVLFYNRDLLNSAGVSSIPRYWNDDFLKNVKALTKADGRGEIVQSGVALGSSQNVERYSDILSLLMMQSGAQMLDENGNVAFHKQPRGTSQDYAPGLEALRFYTDFANPIREVYSWNSDMPNSLEAFLEGRTAFFFGYSYHVPMIDTRAPRLNYGISPMLQIEGSGQQINFANFWVETVSKQSDYTDEAWDFIQFAARAENVKNYLDQAQRPTALRSLISQQKEEEDASVFANQLLTATSWYHGNDYNAAEIIIGELIDEALLNPAEMHKALTVAAKKVQQTIK